LAFFKEKGIDINFVDNEMCTPLHWACLQSSFISVHYLLAWGANINAKDKAGYTPMHLAVKAAMNT
jgi:ankyrin repeat protein